MAQDDPYSSKMNSQRLSATNAASNPAGSVYGNKINAQRLSYVNTGDGRPGGVQSGAYSSKINTHKLTSVNPNAFMANASLFSRMGADSAVSSVLRAFYAKALRDERIRKYFDLDSAKEIEDQIQRQLVFLTAALGGPNPSSLDMRAEYAKLAALGVNHDHFDAVAEYVTSILRGQNIPEPLIDEVVAFCEATRRNVLG